MPEGETLESLKDYAKSLKSTLTKKAKEVKLHNDYLQHTFPLRRREILDTPAQVQNTG